MTPELFSSELSRTLPSKGAVPDVEGAAEGRGFAELLESDFPASDGEAPAPDRSRTGMAVDEMLRLPPGTPVAHEVARAHAAPPPDTMATFALESPEPGTGATPADSRPGPADAALPDTGLNADASARTARSIMEGNGETRTPLTTGTAGQAPFQRDRTRSTEAAHALPGSPQREGMAGASPALPEPGTAPALPAAPQQPPTAAAEPPALAASQPEGKRAAPGFRPAADAAFTASAGKAPAIRPANTESGYFTRFATGAEPEEGESVRLRSISDPGWQPSREPVAHESRPASESRTGPQPAPPELPRAITSQIAAAVQRFPDRPVELTLSPVELGRVTLTLSTSESGAIGVSLTAERAETLELMRRSIGVLAQEFREIGYGQVSFHFGKDRGHPDQRDQWPSATDGEGGEEDISHTQTVVPALIGAMGRLDIRL